MYNQLRAVAWLLSSLALASAGFAQQTRITIEGLQAESKVYDGNTTAIIQTDTYTLPEPQAEGHDVQLCFESAWAEFAQAEADNDIRVFIYGLALKGDDAHLYTLSGPPLPPTHGGGDDATPYDYATMADITPATLSLAGTFTAEAKAYDGTTHAAMENNQLSLAGISGDMGTDVTLTDIVLAFDEATVGIHSVTIASASLGGDDAANYHLSLDGAPVGSAEISPAELRIGGSFSAQDKTYDGTAEATMEDNDLILEGISGDMGTDVSLTDIVLAFDAATLGTHSVTITSAGLTGDDAENYTLSLTDSPGSTANIAARTLTVGGSFTAHNKPYDRSTAASMDNNSLSLAGISGEMGTNVSLTGIVLAFDAATVGTHQVTISSAGLAGSDADNYSLSLGGAPTTEAEITAVALGIGGSFTVQEKIYDESPAATFETNDLTLNGVVAGDEEHVALMDVQIAFADASVGLHSVTITAAGISGIASPNYTFSLDGAPTTSAAIVPGPAAQLVIHTQPSPAATRSETFTTQPLIHIQDAFGNLVYDDNETTVTASIATGSGELDGTRQLIAVNGVVSFSDLSHATAEIITIRFTSGPALTETISDEIRVVHPHEANKLHIHQQPSPTATAGEAFDIQPVVHIHDFYNELFDDSETVVTASIYSGNGELLGTRSVTADEGVATFENLSHRTAEAITIEFTASPALLPDISDEVMVGPRTLTITVNDDTRTYGAANPAFSFQDFSAHLMDGDQMADITGGSGTATDVEYLTETSPASNAGVYAGDIGISSPSLNGPRAGSYQILVAKGQLEITKKDLQVTAVAPNITYGDEPPVVSVTYEGFVNDDHEGLLDNTSFILGSDYNRYDPVDDYQTTINMGAATDNNYHFHPLLTSSFSVGQRSLTVSGATADSKPYDGNTEASISGASLVGVVNEDDVSLDALSGQFHSRDAGQHIPVDATLTLAGDHASNYEIIQPGGLTADINPRTLTIAGEFSAREKPYDEGIEAEIATQDLSLENVVAGEEEKVSLTGVEIVFASHLVGTHEVYIIAAALTGEGSHNYALSLEGSPTTTADIVPGPPEKLAMFIQPAEEARAGEAFDPQPVVHITDAYGNLVPTASATPITASALGGVSELNGTRSVTTQDGVATFEGLSYQVAEAITIYFSADNGLTGITSREITVAAGWPSTITLTQTPDSEVFAGIPMSPWPSMIVHDAFNNPVPDALVQAETDRYHFCAHCDQQATTDPNGVASFDNLVLNIADPDYEIRFSVEGAAGSRLYSAHFELKVKPGYPASASIIQGPTTVRPDMISDRYTLTITDDFGNPSHAPEQLVFTLSSTATPENHSFYKDAEGEQPTTSELSISPGQSSSYFWYRDEDLYHQKDDFNIGTRTLTGTLTEVLPAGKIPGQTPKDEYLLEPATYLVEVTDHWVWVARQENMDQNSDWTNLGNWNHGEGLPSGEETVILRNTHANVSPRIDDAQITVGTVLVDCEQMQLTIGPRGALSLQNLVSLSKSGDRPLLRIESDEKHIGSFIHHQAGVQARVERTMAGGSNAWQQVSAPVSEQSFGNTPYAAGSVFSWYEPAQRWVSLQNNSIWPTWDDVNAGHEDFIPGKGYLLSHQDQPKLIFEGELNHGKVSLNHLHYAHADDPYLGFNMAGNPFASYIDLKAPDGWDNLYELSEQTIWIWDHDSQQYGSYTAQMKGDGGVFGASRYIAPTQGFWVRAGVHTVNLGMDAGIRTHTYYEPNGKDHGGQAACIRLQVVDAERLHRDELLMEFGHIPPTGGARKMFSMQPHVPSLFTTQNGAPYSIALLGDPHHSGAIPLHFSAGMCGSHQLVLSGPAPAQVEALMLEDLFTGQMHPLEEGRPYHFEAFSGDAPDRFLLHLQTKNPTHASMATETPSPLRAYASRDHLYVDAPGPHTHLQLHDMSGRVLIRQSLQGQALHRLPHGLSPGVYILSSGTHSIKLIIP